MRSRPPHADLCSCAASLPLLPYRSRNEHPASRAGSREERKLYIVHLHSSIDSPLLLAFVSLHFLPFPVTSKYWARHVIPLG